MKLEPPLLHEFFGETLRLVIAGRDLYDHPKPLLAMHPEHTFAIHPRTTALRLQASRPQVSLRERKVILSEKANFPTDLYVAQGLIDLLGMGHELKLVEFDEVLDAIDDRCAVVMLTHVNFRTGAMHDMQQLTQRAHGAGALSDRALRDEATGSVV